MGYLGGSAFQARGIPSSTWWWEPSSVHVGFEGEESEQASPASPPTPLSRLETRAALRHGLCHHDRRGCGPHGAGRRDCHAQGLRLGQYQPARVSRAPPGMAPRVHALAWPGFLAAIRAPAFAGGGFPCSLSPWWCTRLEYSGGGSPGGKCTPRIDSWWLVLVTGNFWCF